MHTKERATYAPSYFSVSTGYKKKNSTNEDLFDFYSTALPRFGKRSFQ